MYRFDEAGPRLSGALLGICVASILQIITLEKPKAEVGAAATMFALTIPYLLALWAVSSHPYLHNEVEKRRGKKFAWRVVLGLCGMSTATGFYFFVSHVGTQQAQAFAWSCFGAVMLVGVWLPDFRWRRPGNDTGSGPTPSPPAQ